MHKEIAWLFRYRPTVIHDFRPLSHTDFYHISDTYETSSLIFTTNKEVADWAEMMGDPVLTTALLDRILQHASCFSFTGESYRLKHPHTFPAPLVDSNNIAAIKNKG
jgi:hypothetical protein